MRPMRTIGGRLVAAAALWVVSVCLPASGLDPGTAITQYVESTYRAPQYLPHDDVSSVLQTRDGYLWVGTVEGLARFDGARSVVFDKANTPAFRNNWIRDLLEDREGRLWIATYNGGLVCRENGSFRHYGAEQGIPADIILSLMEDREGRVWVGTHGAGLFRLEGDRFVRETGFGIEGEGISDIVEDRDGVMWIGTESGLFRHDARGTTRVKGLPDDEVRALAEDRDGLWVGTVHAGLARIVGDRVTTIGPKDGLSSERIWYLAVDRRNNLWVATDGGGLDRVSDGKVSVLSTANGLANDYVWAVHEDREGSLWIGTNGGGLTSLRDGSIHTLTTRDGLPSNFIWSVLGTRDGSLWVGTEDAGVARIVDGRATVYTERDGLATNAKVLYERRDGSVLIGGNEGVAEWRDGRIRMLPIWRTRIAAMLEDPDGTLWIASGTSGLMHWTPRGATLLTKADGLAGNALMVLHRARDGALWIGTLTGLSRIADGTITSWTKENGLTTEYVTSIFEDDDGTIWGTSRSGVWRLRDGAIRTVTSLEGLYDDAIVVAVRGKDGALWMGGNRGLHRTPIADLNEVMDGTRQAVRSRAFGLEDGLRSVEINGSMTSGWRSPEGRMYFATREGVAIVDPDHLVRNSVPPPVVIEDVAVDGKALEGPAPWTVPAGTRRIEIRFTALSFVSPGRVRVRHRLDGFDPDWIDTDQRTTSYTNLRAGEYTFRVIAANSDGVWNDEGASVSFTVKPRFYETIWFRTLIILVFALVGPAFYYVRVGLLRRKQAELERLVAARTAEVQAANERLAQLASEDGLTGVANRRRLDEALDQEWRRAYRAGTALALLLVDVDFFKQYNDRLGHVAGDECLRTVARSIADAHTRAGEVVARFGGEEFALLIPGIERDRTEWVAEDLRQRIQALALPHPDSAVAPVVTVSVGVAWTVPSGDASLESLVSAADAALYSAKRGGRNRVEIGDAPGA